MRKRKKITFTKIVDTVVATSRMQPLNGGKIERWWNDDAEGKQGIKKIGKNRTDAGEGKEAELTPSVAETLVSFHFKGFEFGNWLSQAERYDVFRAFQVCLRDMYKWLDSQNIGFDNCFGVAFGARGSRGASAHYEAWSNIINMTKEYGSGAFLHEYAHAIDYSVGAFFDQNKIYSALSGGHHVGQSLNNVGGQFRAMMNKILIYVRSTESYKKMLSIAYYRLNKDYWGNSTELFARLTEAYYSYFYNSSKNYYLVKPENEYELHSKKDGTYLSKSEISIVKPELDKFWKEVSLLLNNKCTLKATPFPKIETESYFIAITFTIKEDWEWRGTKIEKDSHSLYFNREFKSKEDAVRELKKIKEELKKSKVVKKVNLSDNKLDADFLARTGQDTPLLSENITWEIKTGTLSKLDSKYAYDVHFPYWVLDAHKFTLTTDKFLSMAKKIGSEFEKKDAKEKSATSRVYFHKSGMENKASNYIAKHITPNSAKNLLSEIEKLAKKERLIPDRRQTRYGDTVYATVNGIELLFHDTLFSLNKSVKEDKKKEIKKKVEKRPDKLSFDFGKFVSKDDLRPFLKYTWEKDNFRVACDMFHMAYEKLEDSLDEGYVRVFDKKNNLIYSGLQDGSKYEGKLPNFASALQIKEIRSTKIDAAQLQKSLDDLKATTKENKEKLKQFSTKRHEYDDEYIDAEKKSHWLDHATFVVGGIAFTPKSIAIMIYASKAWKLNTLYIENGYNRGCKMRNEDGNKQVLIMPVNIVGTGEFNESDLHPELKKMLKQRGYFVDIDFL